MRSLVLASFVIVLAGCGLVLDTSPPDPEGGPDDPPVAVDCEKDEDCDDGIACTVDRCLRANDAGALRGCYSVPRDDLCPPPSTSAGCAVHVCMPSATWDHSGCALAPLLGVCGAEGRCNLATLECEELPDDCDACDDGDPCNGVEACGSDPDEGCVRTTLGCGDVNDGCVQQVCDARSDVRGCVERRKPSEACFAVSP